MLVKDAFKEVFTGFNMTNSISGDKYVKDVYFIQKDSIQYVNIVESKLVNKRIDSDIKDKYYMKERDIISGTSHGPETPCILRRLSMRSSRSRREMCMTW